MATWKIETMNRNISDGGVTVAHWTAVESETVGTGEDAITYSSRRYGSCSFTPDPSAADFVAYDDLTEATVLGWVHADVDKDAIEASLTAQITEQKTPTKGTGMPW